MARILLFIIDKYQKYLSPIMGRQCRFVPTCSEYSKEAIIKHGAIKGSYLMINRIFRCNPWCKWGYDPVPEVFSFKPKRSKK